MTGKWCLPCRRGRSPASSWCWNGSPGGSRGPWYSRLVEEFQARGNPGNPEAAEGMVENLGRGLFQLKQAVTLPGLPESLRDRFPAEIQDGADRIQASLEASARQSHSGELQHILQLHPVNRWEEKQNHEQPK